MFGDYTHFLYIFPCYIDTESLYTITIQQIANQHQGRIFTWEMKSKLMGMMGREAAVAIIETLDLPMKPEQYMSESQEIMAKMFPSCKFLPGQANRMRRILVSMIVTSPTLSSLFSYCVIPSVGRTTADQGSNPIRLFYLFIFFILFSHGARMVVSILIAKTRLYTYKDQNSLFCELFLSCLAECAWF